MIKQQEKKSELIEVWGDTVNIGELTVSILLGIIFTMSFYLIGRKILLGIETIEPSLAKGYALFIGIVGCILSATVSAIKFKPKRVIGELNDIGEIEEVLSYANMTLEEEAEALTKVSPEIIKEMEDLELYALLSLIPEGKNNYKPEYKKMSKENINL